MGEKVLPAVIWLLNESLSISGELFLVSYCPRKPTYCTGNFHGHWLHAKTGYLDTILDDNIFPGCRTWKTHAKLIWELPLN